MNNKHCSQLQKGKFGVVVHHTPQLCCAEVDKTILELPPEGIVGSEVGTAEGLVRDIGSGVLTTFFSLPSFVCAFIYLSSLCSTTLKFKIFLLFVNIASTKNFL